MAEIGASDSSSTDTDRDFDPSADMLIHDYDDEQTLEEEEALSGESCSNELDDLEKESEMPIEELLAMYRYGGEQQESRSSSEEEILSNQDLTLDKDEIARDLLKHSDDDDDKETSVHDLLNSVHMASSTTARLLRSNSQHGSEDDDSDESDDDYKPVEPVDDWKKTIQVGSDYQAQVPDGLCKYGDAPAYENEDRLLWDPSKLEDPVVEKYLDDVHTQAILNATGIDSIPTGQHIRDDEQALYLLLQCGHNVEEALRRRKMQAVPPSDPMSLWSEEECRNFENGLRIYGKDFYLIQQNKVKTRSVGELIQFYYLWKKTERHDIFANKNRIEKRKYTLHPGITDYMDRFLDDQETPLIPPPAKERSSSPVTSLIFGDPKRNQIKTSVESSASDVAGVIEPSEPPQFDLSAASPTILTMRPDLKRPKSSSPMKDVLGSSTTGEDHSLSNGVVDKEDLEPVVKKIKSVPDTSSFYELQESYSDAKPSPLEGKSVAQLTSKDSNMSVEHSSSLSTALSLPSDLHTVTSHHFTESVAQ